MSKLGDWPLPQVREWARARRACWDVDPHTEMVKDAGLRHVGLTLELFARPDSCRLADGGSRASADLWEDLKELASSVVRPLAGVETEIEPYEPAVHLRAENHFAPEVELRLTLSPRSPAGAPPDWARTVRARLEHALHERGLAAKAWTGALSA